MYSPIISCSSLGNTVALWFRLTFGEVKWHVLLLVTQLSTSMVFFQKTYLLSRPTSSADKSTVLCGFVVVFWGISRSWGANWKGKSLEAAYPGCVLFVWHRQTFPSEEGGGEDHVSCNYIYVGSHSICHSKFCLTCHIVNHYSGLDAGYELKRPGKDSFFLSSWSLYLFVLWQVSCDNISRAVFPGCFQ